MNKTPLAILITFLLISHSSFAGESLRSSCSANSQGTLLKNVKIQNYNYNTTLSNFNLQTSISPGKWFSSRHDNGATIMYDMAKTARLTGERVDICINTNGNYLLGIEWTYRSQ